MGNLWAILKDNENVDSFSEFRQLGRDIMEALRRAGYKKEEVSLDCIQPGDESCTLYLSYRDNQIVELTKERGNPNIKLSNLLEIGWRPRCAATKITMPSNVYNKIMYQERANAQQAYGIISDLLLSRFGLPEMEGNWGVSIYAPESKKC